MVVVLGLGLGLGLELVKARKMFVQGFPFSHARCPLLSVEKG